MSCPPVLLYLLFVICSLRCLPFGESLLAFAAFIVFLNGGQQASCQRLVYILRNFGCIHFVYFTFIVRHRSPPYEMKMAWNTGICLSQGKRHRPLKNRASQRIKRLVFDLYLNRFSRLNEFRICRVVERDHGGPAEALLPAADQTAVLQLPENAGGRLTASVKLLLSLFHGEIKADGAVRFEKTIDLGMLVRSNSSA